MPESSNPLQHRITRQRIIEKPWVRALLLYSSIAIAVLLTIPRIASAEFGILDDAETLRVSRDIQDGDWSIIQKEEIGGRFRPLYWLQYAAVYSIVGADPTMFFVWHALLFALLTFELILLVRKMGGGRWQSWVAGLFFVLAGPIIENVYTLSKPELLQSVFFLAALLLFAAPRPRPVKVLRLAGYVVLGAVLLLLATVTKETGAAMVPVTAIWLVIALFRYKGIRRKVELARWGALFLSSVVAISTYFFLRELFIDVTLSEGTYSNNVDVSLAALRDSALRWSGWLIRDFVWMIPLLVLPFMALRRHALHQARLLVGALIWILVWIGLYLPWEFAVEYYMLPLTLGVSATAATIFSNAAQRGWSKAERVTQWIAVGLAVLLWLTTVTNNLSNARQQLTVDGANARMLRYLSRALTPDDTAVINIQFENEYVYGVWRYLQTPGNPNGIDVDIFDPRVGLPGQPAWIISPELSNQPRLAVRMGVIEDIQNDWNRSLLEALGDQNEPEFQIDEEFRLAIVDLPRAICLFAAKSTYCQPNSLFIDTRDFHYGWKVYFWDGG